MAAASCEEETERHEDTGTQTCWTDFTTAYCQISGEKAAGRDKFCVKDEKTGSSEELPVFSSLLKDKSES